MVLQGAAWVQLDQDRKTWARAFSTSGTLPVRIQQTGNIAAFSQLKVRKLARLNAHSQKEDAEFCSTSRNARKKLRSRAVLKSSRVNRTRKANALTSAADRREARARNRWWGERGKKGNTSPPISATDAFRHGASKTVMQNLL